MMSGGRLDWWINPQILRLQPQNARLSNAAHVSGTLTRAPPRLLVIQREVENGE